MHTPLASRVIGNLVLLIISVLLSALLLEQGFRCILFGWQAFDRESLRNNVPITNAGFMIQSPFDDIYWALKPGLDTTFKLAQLTTNSHGLADREYALEKPANSFRIAVLGDSYSMASGVDTDKSFHALLEKRMNTNDKRPYEIINFAVGGFGLERYNATLEHLVPAWQPDGILLGYCGFNDQQPLPPATGQLPLFNPPRADGFWTSYVYEYFQMMRQDRNQQQDTRNRVLKTEQLAFIDRELERMRTLADRIKPGMPILLAYLDNRQHSAQDLQNIASIAQKNRMLFVDTSQQFAGKKIDDYRIHLLDSHPDQSAQILFADTIYHAIVKQNIFGFSGDESP